MVTLQTYLKQVGYTITDASGRFQSTTLSAVKGFQYELGISNDGVAGQNTCIRLNAVHASEYFNTYGKPITSAQWGQANILKGNFNDVDLMARIILAESGYKNTTDEKGVAIVIKNRSVNSNSAYWASSADYPNASIYARVIGKASQYASANAGNETAQAPRRGIYGYEADGFIDPGWKEAVDLAKNIVNGIIISVSAYKVDGTDISSTMMTINTTNNKNYLNQTAWSKYVSNYNAGKVDSTVQPLTFSSTSGSNVIYKV